MKLKDLQLKKLRQIKPIRLPIGLFVRQAQDAVLLDTLPEYLREQLNHYVALRRQLDQRRALIGPDEQLDFVSISNQCFAEIMECRIKRYMQASGWSPTDCDVVLTIALRQPDQALVGQL